MKKTMHNKSQANSNYFQNLDAISGMKELSDEAAATCSGGAAESVAFKFDYLVEPGGTFTVKPGGRDGLSLTTDTQGGDGIFNATFIDVNTGDKLATKNVFVGNDKVFFPNAKNGHTYKLRLTDEKDGKFVVGSGIIRGVDA
jgi:hypothetical protein